MEKEVSDSLDAELEAEKRKISELYREIKGGADDSKLKWMYKNPLEVVEREEYLLGRSVDKALDFISGKNDGASTSKEMSNMPKRVVTDENRRHKDQVDIQKKVLEDPLFAIRQKEIDARKELLKNPVKMKQIKAMIDAEAKKAKRAEKRTRAKVKKFELGERVNYLLLKRLKKLSKTIDVRALVKSVQEESSDDDGDSTNRSKSKKKTEKEKKLSKPNASDKDRRKRKKQESSASESESDRKNRKKKIKVSDSSSSDTQDSSDEKHSKQRRKKKNGSDSSDSESENSLYKKYLESKDKKAKRSPSSSSSETDSSNERDRSKKRNQDEPTSSSDDESSVDERRKKKVRRQNNWDKGSHKNTRGGGRRKHKSRSVLEHSQRRAQKFQEMRETRQGERRRNRGSPRGGFRGNRGSYRGGFRGTPRGGNRGSPRGRRDENKRSDGRRRRSRSPTSGNDDDENDGGRERRYKPSRNWRNPDGNAPSETNDPVPDKVLVAESRQDRNRRPDMEDSSKEKKYGLSTVDGSRPELSPKEFIQEYSAFKKKEEKKKYVAAKPAQLTEEQVEAQLKAMLDNAKWRKKEQETESVHYRKQKEVEDKVQDYDKDFVRKQVANLTSHGSMADRIKSNVNNIQRSSSSMSQNFLRK